MNPQTKHNAASVAFVEPLDARIAPAALLTYTDVDGDLVKIIVSKGTLTGHATFTESGVGQHLDLLNLTDDSFAGTKLIFKVKAGPNGDGFANVGFIDATGNDLKKVVVKGDLDRIVAGDGNAAKPAIKKLVTQSIGAVSFADDGGGSGSGDPTDPGLVDDVINILDGVVDDTVTLLHNLLNGVGGILGDLHLEGTAQRLLNVLNVDLQGLQELLVDGTTFVTGGGIHLLQRVYADLHNILDLSSDDLSLLGNALNGQLLGLTVQIGNLLGIEAEVQAGTGILPPGLPGLPDLTGILDLTNIPNLPQVIENLPVIPDLPAIVNLDLDQVLTGQEPLIDLGGIGVTVDLLPDDTSTLLGTIGGVLDQVLGLAPADLAGLPDSVKELISGVSDDLQDVLNGDAPLTATLTRTLALLQSNLSSVVHFATQFTDQLSTDLIDLLNGLLDDIGDLLGGDGGNGGGGGAGGSDHSCDINGNVGKIKVRGDVAGAFLNVFGNINKIRIGGSLVGGDDVNSGEIFALGKIDSVKIGHSIVGGSDLNSGLIHANGTVGKMKIGGSLLGGTGTNSASIAAQSDVGNLTIKGNLSGNEGLFSGTTFNQNGRIGAFKVGGSVIGGNNEGAAAIFATDDIGKVRIGGSVVGDADHSVGVAAIGEETQNGGKDPAFKSIKIKGSVQHAAILAGFDVNDENNNGSAQIGKVVVNGNWMASSISAGVDDTSSNGYGNADDAVYGEHNPSIVSRIALIKVRGGVAGTSANNDHYGFTAGEIAKVVVGKSKLDLNAGAANDSQDLSQSTGDVTVRELAPASNT